MRKKGTCNTTASVQIYRQKANGTITHLYLDGNKIGDDGVRALADGLTATLALCF